MSSDLRNQPESYWKEKLTPEQYKVVRQKGTERAFTGALYNNHAKGMYQCVACGQDLFSSDTKFDSGTGWPSFDQPINKEHVELHEDRSFFMKRTEVVCKNCGAHLGHLFDDGRERRRDNGIVSIRWRYIFSQTRRKRVDAGWIIIVVDWPINRPLPQPWLR